MTLEEYLQAKGFSWRDERNLGDDGIIPGEWGRYGNDNEGGLTWDVLGGDNQQNVLRAYQEQQAQQSTPQPTPEPVVAQPQAPQPVALPTPKSLEEYLQQQGFNEYKPLVMGTGADYTEEIKQKAGYGKTIKDATEDYPAGYFQYAPAEVIDAYYNNPKNFVQTRETPVGQGINTFNEGNPDQKRIIDQINTGQLMIVPSTAPDVMGRQSNEYNVVDSRTGQVVQPNITAIDASKGIFNIVAADPNSSGYFNNYVSTDPNGFVNPIVSDQQSQYASHANNSLNFIKDSVKGLLTMAAMAATAGGYTAALGAGAGLGEVGSNVALNAAVNAAKQGIDGQFNPLGLATSAALSYGLGGAGGADPLTADDMYTGQAMTNLASSDDATRLADLVRAFENPTELTGPTGLVAGEGTGIPSGPSVELGNATVEDTLGLPSPKLQPDMVLEDFSPNVDVQDLPQELDITGSLANPYTSPTFPTLDVSPEYDPNAYLPNNLTNIPTNLGEITPYIPTNLSGLDFQPSVVNSNLGNFDNIPTIGGNDLGGFDNIPSNVGTNLGGYTGIPTDLGGLDVPFDTTGMDIGFKNPDLSAGELTVSGTQDTFDPWDNPEPLPYTPFEENFPTQTETPTTPKILSNILKSTPSALPKAIATQQQSNLANILRGSQMPQTALPPIYHQQNPFNFGQQASPVQDTTALAKLLRTA